MITNAVGSTDVLLALIGDQWLTITDEDGRPRLDNPADFVRLEIEAALARKVRLVPILVDEATMPRADELPPSLAPLARRQALELSPSRFDFDTSRLLRVLDKTLAAVQTRQNDLASTIAPSVKAPHPNMSKVQKAHEQRESASRGPTHAWPAAATPGWRERLSAQPRNLVGVGVFIAVLLAVLVAVIIARSTSTAPSTEQEKSTQATTGTGNGERIFADDFSSRASGWHDAGGVDSKGRYANQAYQISAKPVPRGHSVWYLPREAPDVYPIIHGEVRITVEALPLAGKDADNGYGIVCHADDAFNAYTFTVSASGYAQIAKFSDGEWKRLAQGQVSLIDGSSNHLQAVCTSGEGRDSVHLQFFINGKMVAKTTDSEHPLPGGSVGLIIATGPNTRNTIDVEFDDFIVNR